MMFAIYLRTEIVLFAEISTISSLLTKFSTEVYNAIMTSASKMICKDGLTKIIISSRDRDQ